MEEKQEDMQFTTVVDIERADFEIQPTDPMLLVGSCFASNLGRRFVDNMFRAVVNPFGVMYNPASILHTVERATDDKPKVAVFTLGTNHVYILRETGEIVDNCQKRPQRLFEERELTVEECTEYLQRAVDTLVNRQPDVKVIVTVSPIRYAKYGYHGSRLSKATLLLATDRLVSNNLGRVSYFPAYEIMNDELRDYRFYSEDMLHPSDQAVEYIWQRFRQVYFGQAAEQFLAEWKPIREALGHKPFNPESDTYKRFLAEAQKKKKLFIEKYFKS